MLLDRFNLLKKIKKSLVDHRYVMMTSLYLCLIFLLFRVVQLDFQKFFIAVFYCCGTVVVRIIK